MSFIYLTLLPVQGIFYEDKAMPTMLHFCQFYLAGDMAFGKRRVTPHNLFTCEGNYICVYVYMCICVYVYIYIYIDI